MGPMNLHGHIGELSPDVASVAAMKAFIHGVADKEATFITVSEKLETLDKALALQNACHS